MTKHRERTFEDQVVEHLTANRWPSKCSTTSTCARASRAWCLILCTRRRASGLREEVTHGRLYI